MDLFWSPLKRHSGRNRRQGKCAKPSHFKFHLNTFGGVVEVNRVVPGSERVAVVRVHHVRLPVLEARQAGPVATALDAKAAGYPRAEAFRPRDLSDEVHLLGLWSCCFLRTSFM